MPQALHGWQFVFPQMMHHKQTSTLHFFNIPKLFLNKLSNKDDSAFIVEHS